MTAALACTPTILQAGTITSMSVDSAVRSVATGLVTVKGKVTCMMNTALTVSAIALQKKSSGFGYAGADNAGNKDGQPCGTTASTWSLTLKPLSPLVQLSTGAAQISYSATDRNITQKALTGTVTINITAGP